MPVVLKVNKIRTNGTWYLSATGKINCQNITEFREQLGQLLSAGCRQVVVDCAHLESVNSDGLFALYELSLTLLKHSDGTLNHGTQPITLVSLSESIFKLIKMCALDRYLLVA